ncbi:MAG: CHAT domain-containing protein [Acidobacteria bacterium]|nr:CHAT domain-containing protein [Acidobacteriota bacterium]
MLLLLFYLIFPFYSFTPKTVITSPSQEVIIPKNDMDKLEQGKTLELELKAGDSHSYQISLNAGQYLKVVVEQNRIDVAVSIFDADNKQLQTVDSPNAEYGQEPLSFISEKTANYKLKVQSTDKRAKPGKYKISIIELRQAIAKDSHCLTAQQILSDIYKESLSVKITPEFLQKTIESYEAALKEWQLVGDQERIATTLYSLGGSYKDLDENQKGLDFFHQALEIIKKLEDKGYEAQLLGVIGTSYQVLQEHQKALDYLCQALAIYQKLDDIKWQVYVLYSIGVSYVEVEELQKALDSFNQALSLPLPNNGVQTVILSQIGVIYDLLGEYQKALDFYHQAISGKKVTDDPPPEFAPLFAQFEEAHIFNYIGIVYIALGEPQKALDYLNQSLAIVKASRDKALVPSRLSHIGIVYEDLGENQKALDFHNQALQLARSIDDKPNTASALRNLGRTYFLIKENQKAIDCFNQALVLARAIEDKSLEASTFLNMAKLKYSTNEYKEALALTQQALTLIESLRTKISVKELRASFTASQNNYYEFYIDLLMKLHQEEPSAGYDVLALQASERARARTFREILTEARIDIRQGIDPQLLERERNLRKQINIKAENLLQLFTRKHTEAEENAAKQEAEKVNNELQYVEALIYKNNPHYAAQQQPQPITLDQIQEQLLDDTVLLEYALGSEHSYVWAVTQTSIASYKLPKRTEIETLALRVYQLFTARERKSFESDEKFAQRLNKAQSEMAMAVTELSNMVLKPMAEHRQKKRLLIVSEGMLQYVPFAALPLPTPKSLSRGQRVKKLYKADWTPLLLTHEVTNLPSVASLALQRQEILGRKPASKNIAIFANPVFSLEDNRLKSSANVTNGKQDNLSNGSLEKILAGLSPIPETEKMARDILAITPGSANKLMLGFDANLAMATKQEIGQYRIVHYATHGFLSPNPELSGIVLSLFDVEGRNQNGFLSAAAIFNLDLPVDLVILSACRTGLALDPEESDNPFIIKQRLNKAKDLGVVGLTRGFVYAGASRVMVTMWNIPVEATSELMVRFYKHMLGRQKHSPASALRAAQIEMLQQSRWKNPYYWAAFVLNGEYK